MPSFAMSHATLHDTSPIPSKRSPDSGRGLRLAPLPAPVRLWQLPGTDDKPAVFGTASQIERSALPSGFDLLNSALAALWDRCASAPIAVLLGPENFRALVIGGGVYHS